MFVGNIPTEIGALTKLTYLNFYNNDLSGNICTTLYHNPIQKSHWTIVPESRTKIPLNDPSQHTNLVIFEGNIPAQIGQLTALTELYLFQNQLSGKLHSWKNINRPVTNTNLVIFVGNIPTEIGQLTALIRLDLDGNKLSGKIIITVYQNSMENHINKINGHVTY